MSGELFFTLFCLAAVAGFGSGFIGLGGGLLLFPLLLYVPPYLGIGPIDAKTVAALVLSQVFFGGLVGGTAHWREGRVHKKLTCRRRHDLERRGFSWRHRIQLGIRMVPARLVRDCHNHRRSSDVSAGSFARQGGGQC